MFIIQGEYFTEAKLYKSNSRNILKYSKIMQHECWIYFLRMNNFQYIKSLYVVSTS